MTEKDLQKTGLVYKDGGTTVYVDNKGKKYYRDGRPTKTNGKFFTKYPSDEGAELVIFESEKDKINELLLQLDKIARDESEYEYGLPIYNKDVMPKLREAVKQWLTSNN